MLFLVVWFLGQSAAEKKARRQLESIYQPDGSLIPEIVTAVPRRGPESRRGSIPYGPIKACLPAPTAWKTAPRKTGQQVRDHITGDMIDEIVQYLPAKYNRQSELNAEVSDDGANSFDFKLKSE